MGGGEVGFSLGGRRTCQYVSVLVLGLHRAGLGVMGIGDCRVSISLGPKVLWGCRVDYLCIIVSFRLFV